MAYLDYQHGDEATREQRRQLRLKWFGPSRAQVWKRLAEETSAHYQKRFWRGDRVLVKVGVWELVLDTHCHDDITHTRMRAPYVNADGFRFTIFRKHLFSGLAEAMGLADIVVGDPPFDDQFIIRGTDESKVRRLFASERIRQLVMAQPRIRFEVKDDEGFFGARFPEGVDKLQFVVPGVIKDIDRLKLLYELFAETLTELCRMGSAYDCEPGVRL